MALTKELLEEKGFVFESEENGIFQQYTKKISDEGKALVLAITPISEVFVWLPDTECGSQEDDGVRVVLDTDDLDLAVKCAEIIAGVEID